MNKEWDSWGSGTGAVEGGGTASGSSSTSIIIVVSFEF